ncbi:MAG TPA: hypothetical protein VJZ26_14540 [Blastocatellia bacterium]|nr:hypothetical protein [Blastocatellia bacterium]
MSPNLKPTFALSIGSFSSTDGNAVGGPRRLIVDRDMSFGADCLELELFDRAGVALDDDVKVELGLDDERKVVFKGNVVEVLPALIGVRVLALGKMNSLLRLRTAATYENQTAGGIVRDLISQSGLEAGTVDEGPTLPRFAVDQFSSAYRFAKDLAERLGYEFYTDREGKVMFHALGAGAGLDAAGGLLQAAGALAGGLGSGGGEGYQFGKHLIAAEAGRRISPWGVVAVGGESAMSTKGDTTAHWLTTESDNYRGSDGEGEPQRLLLDSLARTKDLADRFAAGYRVTLTRKAGQLFVTTLGRSNLELGDNVSVSGMPDDLANGNGYVQAIRHRFGDGFGFLTDLRIVQGPGK